jgi:alpha-D-ribose 1-methylphosphonate 5-triphosphate synthase subunit PhnH
MTAESIAMAGFTQPVPEAQATFRAVLDVMARPGRMIQIKADLHPPAPLDRATAAVALTLVDQETALFLDPAMRATKTWLAFHANAALIDDETRADFIIASSIPDLAALQAGSDEAPEAAATLILQVVALGVGPSYRLAGPGLAAPTILQASGLPDDFVSAWRRNHARFPRGIDIILCAGDHVAALPRSVAIEAA